MEVLTSTGEMTPAQIAQKLVGMAGDGAAVISGQYSGVQAQLRMNHAPHVVWSHCAGHKINLIAGVVVKVPLVASLETVLKMAGNFFSNSPQRLSNLAEWQDWTETEELKMKKFLSVRWLSAYGCNERLIQQYRPLLLTVQQWARKEGSAQSGPATALCEQLCTASVYLTAIAMQPLLEVLQVVCKRSQKADLMASDVSDLTQHLERAVRNHYFGESVGLETIFRGEFDADGQLADGSLFQLSSCGKDAEVAIRFKATDGRLPFVLDQDGQHITTLEGLLNEARLVMEAVRQAAQLVLDANAQRFPDVPLMGAFEIFEPKWWRSTRVLTGAEMEALSMSHLTTFADKYGDDATTCDGFLVEKLVDGDALKSEWTNFAGFMKARVDQPAWAAMEPREFWTVTFSTDMFAEFLPNFARLAQVLLVLPMTSVENERHFSLMAFIKNNKRNRMLEPHLNICTRLFTCKHTFKTLPTEECLRQWLDPDGTQRVKRRKLYR